MSILLNTYNLLLRGISFSSGVYVGNTDLEDLVVWNRLKLRTMEVHG